MPYQLDPASRVGDILDEIAAIEEFTASKTFERYRTDMLLRRGVERSTEIISEASGHLPETLKTSHSKIPWRKVADIGNILRHAYPIVDDDLIWTVVNRDLPVMKAAASAMLSELESKGRE